MLHLYGSSSFFLSTDGSLNGNDTQHYVIIAKNLAEGHGYSRFATPPFEPDALRTPLLPLYFLPFVAAGGLGFIWFAMLLLNIVLAYTPVVLYKLARIFLPHHFALVAALFLALEPLFLYRSQIAEPDALLVLFIVSAIYFLVRSWRDASPFDWYAAAALLGISILAKPSALYVAAIVLVAQLVFIGFFRSVEWKTEVMRFATGLCIVLLIISPWLIRNYAVFGVWGVSSISGYNLYEYYTANERAPDEQVPDYIQNGSREPSRYLPFQKYFTQVALARIAHEPVAYAKDQAVGSLRNLFVSDLPAIYYYGHSRLLPFPYNPESKANVHELLLKGDWQDTLRALVRDAPKLAWMSVLALVYMLALFGWCAAWRRDRRAFFAFTLFLALFAYCIAASGPFVDAKYRLPALPLVFLVALYGVNRLAGILPLHLGGNWYLMGHAKKEIQKT